MPEMMLTMAAVAWPESHRAPFAGSGKSVRTSFERRCSALLLGAIVLALSLLAGCGERSHSESLFDGVCTAVLDGDTIEVDLNGREQRIRLEGIDAPERGRPFSARARQKLASLVLNEPVQLKPHTVDRYGRIVARVVVGGLDTSEEMVRSGLAWHYVRYSDDETLARLEQEARARSAGLWIDPHPEPPWEDRQTRREPPPRSIDELAAVRATPDAPYHGNRRSHVFHRPGCEYYDCKNCTRQFSSRQAALDAGYRPCGFCRP